MNSPTSQNSDSSQNGLYPINIVDKMPDRTKTVPGFAFSYKGTPSFRISSFKFVTNNHVVTSTTTSRFSRSIIMHPRKNAIRNDQLRPNPFK